MAFGKPGRLPGGRNRPNTWEIQLRNILADMIDDPMDNTKRITKLRAVAQACVKAAMGGDMFAIREIAERLDGKVATVVQATVNTPLFEQMIPAPEGVEAEPDIKH